MNFIELIVLVFSAAILFLYFCRHLHSLRHAIVVTVLSLIPLYLSIEMVTQFLTIDAVGTNMILEPAFILIPKAKLFCWDKFALRTTDLLLGGIFYVITKVGDISLPFIKMLTKTIHWFVGLIIIIWIHNLISKNFISNRNKIYFSIIFIYTALLLPTNVLALKVFNYDLFSMLLSICAILYLVSAIKSNRPQLALVSTAISVFAAQEKLIASPIFLLSSIIFCFLNSVNQKRRYSAAALSSVLVIGLGLLISITTFFIVSVIGNRGFPNISLFSISIPVIAWWWPLIRLVMGGGSYLDLPVGYNPLFFIICSVLFIFFSCLIIFKLTKLVPKVLKLLKGFNIIFCLLLFIIGVAATYLVKAYWAPYRPIESGFYNSQIWVNNTIWHFGALTKFKHILNFVAYSISVFINAIPSSFWILLLAIIFYPRIFRRKSDKDIFLGWEVILFISLLVPIVFGITQTPVINRYFNIAIFLFAIVILIKLETFLEYLNNGKKIAVIGGFIFILILEILPFRPLYGPFRPIWSNYSEEYSRLPIVGRTNGSWPGWGEEIMLAGKRIKKICEKENINCDDVHIYYNYLGEWTDSKIPHIYPISNKSRYSELDYYILNRIGVTISQNILKFPYSVKPLFTLEFRGFVQAWIFRGDQLKEANFKFQ